MWAESLETVFEPSDEELLTVDAPPKIDSSCCSDVVDAFSKPNPVAM